MSSPKLAAYKAIAEMTAMMAEFMRNPQAIAECGKEAAAAVAMTDVEIQKRDEASKIIEDAKLQSKKLENDKAEFNKNVEDTIKSLTKRKDELDSLQTHCDEKEKSADKVFLDAKKIKSDADILTQQANNKLFDIDSREKAHGKSLEQLAENIRKFEAEKAQHKINVVNLAIRENKLKEALS